MKLVDTIPVSTVQAPSEGNFVVDKMNNKRKTRGGGGNRGEEKPAAARSNSMKTPERENRSENNIQGNGKEEFEGVFKNAR